MLRYIAGRMALMAPVLVLVSVVVFLLLHLTPGDPVVVMLGESGVSPETAAALRHDLGLDQPLYVQYARWAVALLHGDFGRSIRTHQPVMEGLLQRLPVTAELALLAMLFALAVALPVGILSAARRGSRLDAVATVLSLGGAALPNFWLAIMLILFFSLQLRWLPPSGFTPLRDSPLDNLKLLLLPAIGLGVHQAAVLLRLVRSSTLDVLGQDYLRVARMKGLAERLVLRRHALPNALIPVVTVIGLQLGTLLGGAVVTEQIFALPGIGRYLIDNINGRDYPVVQGVVLFMSLAVLAVSLVVDVAYTWIDPRIRHS